MFKDWICFEFRNQNNIVHVHFQKCSIGVLAVTFAVGELLG